MDQEAVGYERDIRPLFRERTSARCHGRSTLASHEDVRANAHKILVRLSNGSMPCDGAWLEETI
jgi:hypothetical protein